MMEPTKMMENTVSPKRMRNGSRKRKKRAGQKSDKRRWKEILEPDRFECRVLVPLKRLLD